MATNAKVWLITGSSTGFGRSLAEAVLKKGDRVIATARKPDQLDDLVAQYPDTAKAVRLDVTDLQEIHDAVNAAIEAFGRIDVLVNNAGFGMIGAVEEVSDVETRHLFDTNLFGLLNVTRAVLPQMRQQESGYILNLSSVGGFVGFVGSGIYCASKFAVEGISETLAQEVEPFGIRVTLVEPGQFRTDFAGRSIGMAPPIDAYADTVGKRRERVAQVDGKQPGNPDKAVQAMIQVVETEHLPLRLALGVDAVRAIETKLESVKADLDAWRQVSLSTAFEE